jgi:hypothetical protein
MRIAECGNEEDIRKSGYRRQDIRRTGYQERAAQANRSLQDDICEMEEQATSQGNPLQCKGLNILRLPRCARNDRRHPSSLRYAETGPLRMTGGYAATGKAGGFRNRENLF